MRSDADKFFSPFNFVYEGRSRSAHFFLATTLFFLLKPPTTDFEVVDMANNDYPVRIGCV
jgi:hypothetical protein